MRKYLNDFKDLQISKELLSKKLGEDLLTLTADNPVIISASDVINVLNSFKTGQITLNQLLEWVNTVWFTDLFDYRDDQADSIASVMDKLEELDEDSRELTIFDIDKYIDALSRNEEV